MAFELSGPTLVAPGVYQLRLPIPPPQRVVNVYLLESGEGLTLVDCGTHVPETWDALVTLLERGGFHLTDIRTILITHFHSDHYGQVGRVVQESGARVFMHRDSDRLARLSSGEAGARLEPEWVANMVRSGAPAADLDEFVQWRRSVRSRYEFVDADRFLADGDTVQLGEHTFEVIETPGHATGHISLYDRARRILVAGDHVPPNADIHAGITPLTSPNPLRDYLDTTRKIAALDPIIALPGHGRVIDNFPARLEEIQQHHDSRSLELLRSLGAGGKTIYEVAQARFAPEAPITVRHFAIIESFADLEFLAGEGLVNKTAVDGVFHYTPAQ